MIALEMAWVVDTGMPRCAAVSSTVADAESAAKPLIGCSFVSLCPSVLMMRQPPEAVPAAITSAQVMMIQVATWSFGASAAGRMNASHEGSWSSVPLPCATKIAIAITPMVFCASLVPCAKPWQAALRICNRPRRKPATGAVTIGSSTFQNTPVFLPSDSPECAQTIELQFRSEAASAAPTMPPISAWLDEDGRPNHQVSRFHRIAPSNAQVRICEVITTTSALTMPVEIVFATAVPAKAPARFITAARITAWPGVSTFVPTTVAIELAVSWKPLMNSKTSAVRMTTMRASSIGAASGVLQHDLVHDGAGVAATVDRLLQQLEEVLEDQVAHRVGLFRVGVAVELEDQAVGLGLDGLHLVVERLAGVDVHALAQQADHFLDDLGGTLEHRAARHEVDAAQALR